MMRPLFLDYPDAARDKHPIDIDQGVESEFLLGHDLLVAPSPYPDEPDAYTVEFPTADWYDYWTGERVSDPPPDPAPNPNAPPAPAEQVALSAQVHPTLDTLPVFVRGGAIVPVQPLVQSTGETPQGPLTLRVYAGDDCRGSLYTDDGESFAFERGDFLRMNFTCTVTNNEIEIKVSKHEGTYAPWWKSLRFEIYGWEPSRGIVQQDGSSSSIPIERGKSFVAVSLPDSGTETSLKLQ